MSVIQTHFRTDYYIGNNYYRHYLDGFMNASSHAHKASSPSSHMLLIISKQYHLIFLIPVYNYDQSECLKTSYINDLNYSIISHFNVQSKALSLSKVSHHRPNEMYLAIRRGPMGL